MTFLTTPYTTTYGLVVFFQQNENDEPLFHITQRRDTLAYIHFIRGLVPEDKVELYFSRMTLTEKERIFQYTFEDLWSDLFSNNPYRKWSEKYKSIKERFDKYQSLGLLKQAYINTLNKSINLEWGLPKGRKKNEQEPDLVCAQREYREETQSKCYLEFIDIPPIECINLAKREKIIYYVAKSKFRTAPKYYTSIGNIKRVSISEETADFKWVTKSEANELVPLEYQKVIQQVSKILQQPSLSFILLREAILKLS